MKYDVCVIGGGPAGMSAALSAKEKGCSVAILERDTRLGGILNQCIHNGFGLHYFKEELTGPEYAKRFRDMIAKTNISVFLETMVLNVTEDRKITAVSPKTGLITIEAVSIVLAMGCRERTAGAIAQCGSRPAGIYSAGMAQRFININGYMVGKKVVILGSGDIGLIMARRMTYEGAKVLAVIEIMPYSAGLKRNIVQCLDDYNIPLYFSHTITKVYGKGRVEGIDYAPLDENKKPNLEKVTHIDCDTILLSVGLIPENDLIYGMGIKMSPITSGAIVDEYRATSMKGFFAAGNVLHVHDLVDNVSMEAKIAGESAANFAKGVIDNNSTIQINSENGVRYALPQVVHKGAGNVSIFFRVDNVYKMAKLNVKCKDNIIFTKRYAVMAPGEMENITLDKSLITDNITLSLEK